ncbi:MAG TPA: hypothetical protein VK534_01295 [Methylomirabilota bacterium]|nr:hypothetical protein [Methylomirabilota bacterium]
MPPGRNQASIDKHAYMPPHIEQAIAQHMQRSMPANLKKYSGANKPAYVPRHIEKQMAQHMEKTMPNHLKQYSGAYMQQKVIQPNQVGPSPVNQGPAGLPSRPPTPDLTRLSHSISTGEQFTASLGQATSSQPGQVVTPSAPQPQPQQPQQAQVPGQAPEPFDFIMNPAPPPKKSFLPSTDSLLKRVLIFSGLALVLLFGFVFLRGLFAGGSNMTQFVSIAQEQQAMIHLTENAGKQPNTSVGTQNFTATAQLSLTSSQTAAITYMKNNKQKVSPKALNLKVSPATDTQLEAATAATTFDLTYQDIMKTKLTSYQGSLKQTYNQTKGPKGRALLSDSYKQAQLLIEQLDQTSATKL